MINKRWGGYVSVSLWQNVPFKLNIDIITISVFHLKHSMWKFLIKSNEKLYSCYLLLLIPLKTAVLQKKLMQSA